MADEVVPPYDLNPHFELALVYLCCCRPKFFSIIGEHIEHDALEDPGAQLAMRIAQVIGKEKGTGPSALNIVCQRLNALREEGKITDEQIEDVVDLFDAAEDNGLPSEEDALASIVPVIKRRQQGELIKDSMTVYGKQGDMTYVADKMAATERLGETTTSMGIGFDEAFDAIEELAGLERQPMGVPEVDFKMEGGSERGSLKCYVGGPGDGKSMALVQDCVEGAISGKNVAYATLELNKARTWNRIIANLTNIPINAVAGKQLDKAKRIMGELQPQMGSIYVEQFTPQVATIQDIREWVKRLEEKHGIKIHMVVVDYGDKLGIPNAGKDSNGYLAMRDVFETFRVWMEEDGLWGSTASQSVRKKSSDKNKVAAIIDINDLADSQHKARVVDIVITLNVSEDEDGEKVIVYFIAKNRNGECGFKIGPLPCDFATARISPVKRGNFGPRGGADGGGRRKQGQSNLRLVQ